MKSVTEVKTMVDALAELACQASKFGWPPPREVIYDAVIEAAAPTIAKATALKDQVGKLNEAADAGGPDQQQTERLDKQAQALAEALLATWKKLEAIAEENDSAAEQYWRTMDEPAMEAASNVKELHSLLDQLAAKNWPTRTGTSAN